MSDSIIGTYSPLDFGQPLRVGTPDPTKYHDVTSVFLETDGATIASRLPGNHGFSGLRGVIIPRANPHKGGGSSGFDSNKPMKVLIDPQFTNGKFVVDIADIQKDPGKMLNAINKSYRAGYEDPADAAIAAFAEFAITDKHPEYAEPVTAEVRELSAQPTAHTPTRAVRGTKPVASFTASRPKNDSTVKAARSLRSELVGETMQEQSTRSVEPVQLCKVIFELPVPGNTTASMGQFTTFYHDVVKQDGVLILVYDHRQPTQMVWFPPLLEDPDTQAPIAMAMLVKSQKMGEEDVLYLAYPTGIRFTYQQREFCLLTIEKEKSISGN